MSTISNIDMLFVPSQHDVMIVPNSSCDRCLRERTSYFKRWENIPEEEVKLLVKYSVKALRVKCQCH